jgi:hypothetical protein
MDQPNPANGMDGKKRTRRRIGNRETVMSERTEIIEPLITHFPLGFAFTRYAAVRQVRFSSGAGKLDVAVVTDEPSILLIEAKKRSSSDSKYKVLGQIIFYLAHALACPTDRTVRAVFTAATNNKANARPAFWNGTQRRAQDPTSCEAEDWIRRATAAPREARKVRALIAMDEWHADHDAKRLLVAIQLLASPQLSSLRSAQRWSICTPTGRCLRSLTGACWPLERT